MEPATEAAFAELTEWIARVDKPTTCPRCASADVRVILYGYRGNQHGRLAAQEAFRRNLAVQGGCLVADTWPTWLCGACEMKGGRYTELRGIAIG
jgi:hypothetical protein